jgi:peptidoglycan/LPS O-acetylase OafA/YrhL
MAGNLSILGELADRISSSTHRRAGWNLTLFGSLLALSTYWFALLLTSNKHLLDMTYVVQLLGAAGLVFSAIFDGRVRARLESIPLRRLGAISFSLYLVHDPIIATLDYLVGNRIIDFVVGIPLSLAVATVFYFIIERPSHKFARQVASRLAPSPGTTVTFGGGITSDNSSGINGDRIGSDRNSER